MPCEKLEINADQFNKRFTLVRVMSSELYNIGCIYHDKLTKRDCVINFLREYPMKNEINVSCTLSNMNHIAFSSVIYYGEMGVNKNIASLFELTPPRRISFMISDKAEGTFELLFLNSKDGPLLNTYDIISFFFETIIALYEARQSYDFHHNDINKNTLLFIIPNASREYKYDNKIFVCNSKYAPKISGFSASTMKPFDTVPLPFRVKEDDLHSIMRLFCKAVTHCIKRTGSLENVDELADFVHCYNSKAESFEEVLNHPIFNSLLFFV